MSREELWNSMGYTEVTPTHMRVVRDGGLQSWGRIPVGGGRTALVAPQTLPNPHSNAARDGTFVEGCWCDWCKGVRERIERHRRGSPCNCQWCIDAGGGQVTFGERLNTVEPDDPGGTRGSPGPIPLDADAMSRPPARIEQVTTEAGRYYARGDERLPSITTVLREYAGPNAGLAAWEERVGADRAREVRDYASAVGDATHAAVAQFLAEGSWDGVMDEGIASAVDEHAERITMLLRERCRRVLAVERRLVHPLGMAGTVDLVCEWEARPGEVKLAVVDHKTKGPRGMHPASLDGYFLQCALYAQAWKAEFGHTPNHLVVIESAKGAVSAQAHEAKAWPCAASPLPSGYAKTVDTGAFIQAFLRAKEACQKW